jgi:4-alpha-glucanotransferase
MATVLDREATDAIGDACRLLGVDRLVLSIHGPSFPGDPADDVGAGCPGSDAGRAFLGFVRALGFTGVQLGPQGETGPDDPSPYNGTLFSRGRLTIALDRLARDPAWGGLLAPETLARLAASRPPGPVDRTAWAYAHGAQRVALDEAFAAFRRRRPGPTADIAVRLARFRRTNRRWLVRDALFEALAAEHGSSDWQAWPAADRRLWGRAGAARRRRLAARHVEPMTRYAFEQLVAHAQHAELRQECARLGLELWGDQQVGLGARDRWAYADVFLRGYALGAPPSRTTPVGQPWGYSVLHPARRGAARLVAARFEKAFAEFDGVRLDHPHGYVCPWVYRTDGDPLAAVRAGARLFAAPDLPDHPALRRFAIAGRRDLTRDPAVPRWADDWVVTLSARQVARYSRLLDVIVAAAGGGASSVACEVLSTCPHPLRAALATHGLGRFRVTQKADLADVHDVYRSENAEPPDWVMVGTHDTRPIWLVVEDWRREGTLAARAAYLAGRLAGDAFERRRLERELATSPALLVQAQFADLFASRARNVLVFFADAFGLREVYNQPGTYGGENWSLRLGPDYRARFAGRLRADAALNLPLVLSMALGVRVRTLGEPGRALRARLARTGAHLRSGEGCHVG